MTDSKRYSPNNPFAEQGVDTYSPNNPFVDAPVETGSTAGQAFSASLMDKFWNDTVFALPSHIGNAPAGIAAAVKSVPAMWPGGESPNEAFQRNMQAQDLPLPARAWQAAWGKVPQPTVQGLTAAVQSAPALLPGGETPGESFQRVGQEVDAEFGALREEFPKASFFGDMAADAAGLASYRTAAGVPKTMRTVEEWITKTGKFRKPDAYFGTSSIAEPVKKGLANWAKVNITSKPLRHLAKGAGRSLETGLDAAVLSMLNDEDPMEMAAYAAGGQAIASAGLTASSHVFSGKIGTIGGKVAVYSVAAGSLWQLVKDATPGGEDSLIDSIEAGYEKVLFALTLGAVSAAVGGGRLRSGGKKSLAENSPIIADTLATFHRGSALTFLRSMVNADINVQQDVETVMQKAWESPEFFDWLNSEQRKGLYKSMEDGTIVQYVEDLKAKSQEFQQRLFKAQKPKDKFPEMKAL